MARRVRLTPLQRDILWMLEEAGEETLATVLATLKPPDREAFERDLKALVRLGYIQQPQRPGATGVVLTAVGRQALTT